MKKRSMSKTDAQEKTVLKKRNIVLKVDPDVFMVIKTYVAMKNTKLNHYIMGLIKQDMDRAGIYIPEEKV